jgi:hypothetical protein
MVWEISSHVSLKQWSQFSPLVQYYFFHRKSIEDRDRDRDWKQASLSFSFTARVSSSQKMRDDYKCRLFPFVGISMSLFHIASSVEDFPSKGFRSLIKERDDETYIESVSLLRRKTGKRWRPRSSWQAKGERNNVFSLTVIQGSTSKGRKTTS